MKRLTISASSTSGTAVLAHARSLAGLARRLERDAQFWRDMGWEAFRLEGYSTQDATDAIRAREITHEEYCTLVRNRYHQVTGKI